jgi:ubiquinone/menaquinone biosynthesis C-methylase UbiE
LAKIAAGDKVLDVGCGTGDLTLRAACLAGPTGEVVGIDASPNMIEVARRKAASKGLSIRWEVEAIERLTFPDDTFDVALSSLMLHHLPGQLKHAGLAEVRRVLKETGTVWLNVGDAYNHVGHVPYRSGWQRPKQLCLVPYRVALALQDDGWWVRNVAVWYKPNALPASVTDRLTNRWEPVFLLAKSEDYFFDLDAIRVKGAKPACDARRDSRHGVQMRRRRRPGIRQPANARSDGPRRGGVETIGLGRYNPSRGPGCVGAALASRHAVRPTHGTRVQTPLPGRHVPLVPCAHEAANG